MNRRFRYTQWMRSILPVLAVALALLGLTFARPLPLVHATDWCGNIDSDTTWTLSGSPHIITCDVQVESGVKLTIDPGVVVKFHPTYALQIDGELIARGTSGTPITFTSNAGTPAPGDWGYILFTDTSVDASYDAGGDYQSGSIIQYATIEYAGGASPDGPNGALRIDDSSPFIDHAVIRHSADSGVAVFDYSGAQKMTHNTITDNAKRGIAASETGSIDISHSTIHRNSGGGLFVDHVTNAEISRNTITANSANDGGGIYVSSTTAAAISHNIIVDNSASSEGGGIYTQDAVVTIENNVVAGNSAHWGGGGYVSDAYTGTTMSFNSILDNQASGNGGGIYAIGADGASVINNTILSNRAGVLQGGVYISSHPDFNDNNIYDNVGYDLHNGNITPTVDLNAQDNWWGTTEADQIDDHILDDDEDPDLGLVDYSSYRSSHRTNAPISPPTDLSATAVVTAVNLVWSSNPESDLDGYKIYYDVDAGFPYSGTGVIEGDSPIDVGDMTAFTLTGLSLGARYYIAVTAYDDAANGTDDQTEGHESWYGDEGFVDVLPDVPTLSPISNADGDGNYLVEWNDVTGTITYTLQEDDDAGFTSPTVRYQGPYTQVQVIGQELGTWWYQVQAANAGGNSSWSDARSVSVESWDVYLPLAMREFMIYFEGPWEVEPNDSYLEANGPLRSGSNYYGYPNDQRDFFAIYVPTSGDIIVDLTGHTGQGVQLQLLYRSVHNLVRYVYQPPYHIEYAGPAGLYYIYIYTESGFSETTPYTLRATFP
jgi:parallel beta-helix repeat protein